MPWPQVADALCIVLIVHGCASASTRRQHGDTVTVQSNQTTELQSNGTTSLPVFPVSVFLDANNTTKASESITRVSVFPGTNNSTDTANTSDATIPVSDFPEVNQSVDTANASDSLIKPVILSLISRDDFDVQHESQNEDTGVVRVYEKRQLGATDEINSENSTYENGEYENGAGEFGNGNAEYGNGAGEYGNGNAEYGNGAGEYGNGNAEYGNGAGEYGNGAGEYGNGNAEYGNGAGEYGNGNAEYGNGAGEYGNNGNGEHATGNDEYGSGNGEYETAGGEYENGANFYGVGQSLDMYNYQQESNEDDQAEYEYDDTYEADSEKFKFLDANLNTNTQDEYGAAAVRLCASWPCQNQGVCESLDELNYTCTCLPGYTGTQCEIAPDDDEEEEEEIEVPLMPGDPDWPFGKGGFDDNFRGNLTCDDAPCLNNGTCVEDEFLGYRCICHEETAGDHCEEVSRVGEMRSQSHSQAQMSCILSFLGVIISILLLREGNKV